MDSITALIKNEILRQYGSIRKFSEESGIPYSTLSNALAKGFGGTSYDTVVKICGLLGIKQAYDAGVILMNDEFYDLYSKLKQLDSRGINTVCSIINVELKRCSEEDKDGVIKGYNGIGLASRYQDSLDPDRIKRLVREVKRHEK